MGFTSEVGSNEVHESRWGLSVREIQSVSAFGAYSKILDISRDPDHPAPDRIHGIVHIQSFLEQPKKAMRDAAPWLSRARPETSPETA